MASITQLPQSKIAKIILIGDSGAGKTGSKASLICEGYKLRMIDADKGFPVLLNLLTNPKYPYAKIIKDRNIDIDKAVDVVPIDLGMEIDKRRLPLDGNRFREELVIKPKNSTAWTKVLKLLERWKDGGSDYGSITSWEDDVILDFDSLSGLAETSYYFNQDLNNHLGAWDDPHGRDTGGAQTHIMTLLQYIYDSSVKCNVILNCHPVRTDSSRGMIQSPEAVVRANVAAGRPAYSGLDVRAYPKVKGRALSPQVGTFFNDQYIAKEEGQRRRIYTTPTDSISAKTSTWLEPYYDISTGLAEIFSALRSQPYPTELVEAFGKKDSKATDKSATLKGGIITQKIA